MFDSLDDTLKNLLNNAPSSELPELRSADVSFETPDKNYTPAQPTVNLFLYEVKENRELRDRVPIVERVGDEFIRRKPPLRVDCSYIVSAWSNQAGAVKVRQEHLLLSQALLWLSRFPTIPNDNLQGSLANQPFPPPTMVAQVDGNKNATGEFWTALGISPRPTFNLVVAIAMDLRVAVPEGLPVVTSEIRLLEIDKPASLQRWFHIGGRVSEAANPNNAIDEAQVKLVEKNEIVKTNAQGQFIFSDLAAGNYTLEVSKVGFTTRSKAIAIPGESVTAYDVALST
jgi:hypothetical protein